MSKKLFVGNLSFNTTEDQLQQTFTAYGEITSATLVSDKMTGRSRGFGFVELADNDAADKAIAELHDKEVDGRKIIVNEARPMKPRSGGGGGGDRGGFGNKKKFNKGPRRW